MPNQQAALDQVFYALADPTRRAVVRRLSKGPASVSELAKPFKMALPSFLQHVEVLERSGLIKTKKVGRVRRCEFAPVRLKAAEKWMTAQRSLWERRLDRLDDYLNALDPATEQSR